MINGNDIMIFWAPADSQASPTLIGATRSNEGQSNCEMIEVASPTTGQWREFIAGRKDWQVNASYLVTAATGVLDLLKVGNEYKIQYRDRNGSTILQGNAILQACTISSIRGNIANGSFQFVGNGALTDQSPSS